MYETILVSKEGGVATVTMNRPDRRNAFNMKMIEELLSVAREFTVDHSVRVVVLTGSTGHGFSSGTDFQYREMRAGDVAAPVAEECRPVAEGLYRGHFRHALTDMILTFHHLEKPTIAMVNGDAVGGGFDLALMCDIRFASPRARFVVGFTRVGVSPVTGSAWFLPRIVGMSKALELIYGGDWISAEEAERLKIVNRLVPEDKLQSETMAYAAKLAKGPPIAYRLAKHLVQQGLNVSLDASLMQSMSAIGIASQTKDHFEALRAMTEKRPPSYKDE
jgi:2-(1,2-epoxy-1,2-dihydrophenyl)acetyl-CoA isomerase